MEDEILFPEIVSYSKTNQSQSILPTTLSKGKKRRLKKRAKVKRKDEVAVLADVPLLRDKVVVQSSDAPPKKDDVVSLADVPSDEGDVLPSDALLDEAAAPPSNGPPCNALVCVEGVVSSRIDKLVGIIPGSVPSENPIEFVLGLNDIRMKRKSHSFAVGQ